MTRILVADGEQRAALAVVRSLGSAGYRVHVAASHPRPLAGASRHARTVHWVPDPLPHPGLHASGLAQVARRIHAAAVLPVTDASVQAALGNASGFGESVLPFPAPRAFARASRKDRLRKLAREVGFAVPLQEMVPDRPHLERLDLDALPYPVTVKSASSLVADGRGRRQRPAVGYAGTPGALRDLVRRMPAGAYPVLVQERILGPGMGVFVLLWDDEVLAHFGHRRLREKPPTGGVSVVRESVRVEKHLLERTVSLLRRLEWRGAAMLEFKVDGATGTPYVLELNGRFWGSLQLAVDAGVDFPRLLVEAALGRGPEPVVRYRTGVRSRWLWGDTDHLIRSVAGGDGDAGAGPRGARLRALGGYVSAFRPGTRTEVLRLTDPRPFLRESRLWLGEALGRRRAPRT